MTSRNFKVQYNFVPEKFEFPKLAKTVLAIDARTVCGVGGAEDAPRG